MSTAHRYLSWVDFYPFTLQGGHILVPTLPNFSIIVGIFQVPLIKIGLPRWLSGKEPSCQWRSGLNPWVGKIPWRRKQQPTPVFLPGKFHGQRSLAGYSLWGLKESDTTEWLSMHSLRLALTNPSGKTDSNGLQFQEYLVQWAVCICVGRRTWTLPSHWRSPAPTDLRVEEPQRPPGPDSRGERLGAPW